LITTWFFFGKLIYSLVYVLLDVLMKLFDIVLVLATSDVRRGLLEKRTKETCIIVLDIEYIVLSTVYSHSAKVSNYFFDCLAELNYRLIVSYWKFP